MGRNSIEPKKAHDIRKIRAAIDQSLGKETSDLIFKTLKLVYKIDEEVIVSNPELFEEKIRKMLGDSAAEAVIKAISKAG